MKRDSGGLAVPQAKRHRGEQQPKLGWFDDREAELPFDYKYQDSYVQKLKYW